MTEALAKFAKERDVDLPLWRGFPRTDCDVTVNFPNGYWKLTLETTTGVWATLYFKHVPYNRERCEQVLRVLREHWHGEVESPAPSESRQAASDGDSRKCAAQCPKQR